MIECKTFHFVAEAKCFLRITSLAAIAVSSCKLTHVALNTLVTYIFEQYVSLRSLVRAFSVSETPVSSSLSTFTGVDRETRGSLIGFACVAGTMNWLIKRIFISVMFCVLIPLAFMVLSKPCGLMTDESRTKVNKLMGTRCSFAMVGVVEQYWSNRSIAFINRFQALLKRVKRDWEVAYSLQVASVVSKAALACIWQPDHQEFGHGLWELPTCSQNKARPLLYL